LAAFLNLPANCDWRIGGGRNKATEQLDIAIIQSLVRKGVIDDRVGNYGHVIVDECHHLSALSFEQVVHRAKGRFLLGVSATVTREDGHHPLSFMQCGPVRYRVNAKAQAATRPFAHTVFVRPTSFVADRAATSDRRLEFQALYRDLIDAAAAAISVDGTA
jgi:superfamily II DNA or RNA helicase